MRRRPPDKLDALAPRKRHESLRPVGPVDSTRRVWRLSAVTKADGTDVQGLPEWPRRPKGAGVVVMKRLHFFDYRELKYLDGFGRAVESPVKHSDAPLLTPDLPWEHGNNRLLGSVVLAGKWSH